jgi:hypothetical protein
MFSSSSSSSLLHFVFSQKNLQHFEARDLLLTEKLMRCKKSTVFFLSVVCEELTSTDVLKIISSEIYSSLLLTVFMCSLRQSCMFFKAVARCQASATKCQASGATSIFPFVFLKKILDFFLVVKNKKKQTRERKNEENSSFFFILLLPFFFFFFILLLPFFFFFFILLVIFFFSYWDFFLLLIPLPRPMSSFVRVGSFLPYLRL